MWFCEDLNLCPCLPDRCSRVPFVLAVLTLETQTAPVRQTEALERTAMNLTGLTVDVLEGIHQTMVLKFGILQMGSEVGLAVRNQAGHAGFQGLAWAVHARVT